MMVLTVLQKAKSDFHVSLNMLILLNVKYKKKKLKKINLHH